MAITSADVTGRGFSPGANGAAPPVEMSVVSTPAACALARNAPTVTFSRALVVLEWIGVIKPHSVAVRYLVDLRIRQVLRRPPQNLRGMRPGCVRVWVVHFVADIVLANQIDISQTVSIVNEAR